MAVMVYAASPASPTASATSASPLVGVTTHPIKYAIAGPPSMVDDGSSLAYFKAHGFSTVELVVPDNGTYLTELNTIKAFGMQPVIDVEVVIWNGGQLQSTPISNFSSYFQSLENAGWQYVASEGGRSGDLTYMEQFFKGYVNYNCDQCGLWLNVYKDPFTVINSWESYYPSEWPYIQNGSTQAAALGIQNGVMAGVWANVNGDNEIYNNSVSGGSPSYKSMLDWSYANGIGFSQFCVWCGLDSSAFSMYEQLGFPQIVANLQTYYPAVAALSANVSTPTAQVNQNYTINGTLRTDTAGIAGANITLQRSVDNATWNNVTTTATDATGNYQISHNESVANTYYCRTAYDGNATYAKATSNVVSVTVKNPANVATLTATASPATATVNHNFRINGTLSASTGGIGNANITLQRSTDNATWNNLATNVTSATGNYQFSKNESAAGTYYYRTAYDGNATYAKATSNVVSVTVTVQVNTTPTQLSAAANLTSVAINTPFTINGTLNATTGTAVSGATIQLQKNVSGTWTNVTGKTSATTSAGAYSVSTSESAASTYQYRTTYAGNSTYVNATSNTVYVTVLMATPAVASSPAVTAQNANSLDLFVNGTDGALHHKYGTGTTWTASTSLGGNSTADPAATSRAAGYLDVFTRGTDGALWSRNTTNNGTSWSAWYKIGGQLAPGTGPAADAQNTNSLDVFAQGTDHVLYYTHWNGATWSAWHSLGGTLTSSPAATSPGNGAIDVFVRGTDGAIWERTTTNGGTTWSTWASLGGQLASGTGPAACSQGSRLDVFAEGTNGALYQKTSTGSWSGWTSLGGALTSSPAATSPTSGVIDVFVRGTDNALWEKTYSSGWAGWKSVGGI